MEVVTINKYTNMSKKGLAPLITIIIIAALVIGAGIIVYQYSKTRNETITAVTSTTLGTETTSTTVLSPTTTISSSTNLPDLIISDLSANKTSGAINEKITISVSEKNIGIGTADLHHVIVTEENKEGVIPILISTSKPLASGDIFTTSGTFTCYYPGKHTLTAKANYKIAAGIVNIEGIQETDETNNTKTITINCTGSIDYKCTDSDGGKNYYVKGSVIDALGFTRHDMCMANNILLEEYCKNNNATDEYYTCPSGYTCQDGACIVSQ
jgi:hypothetical protein